MLRIWQNSSISLRSIMLPFDSLPVVRIVHHSLVLVCLLCGIVAAVRLLRYICFPQPIPGIPHNEDAAKSMSGDLQAMRKARYRRQWLLDQPRSHGTLLSQVLLPFRRPTVIVADGPTVEEICRRKDFDRGDMNQRCMGLVAPEFHFVMETQDSRFKLHREILRDLMAPWFLQEVAAKHIYTTAVLLVELLTLKAGEAQGNSFSVRHDLYLATLDMICGIAFGMEQAHGSLASSIRHIKSRQSGTLQPGTKTFQFPQPTLSPEVEALLNMPNMVATAQSSLLPELSWLALLKPKNAMSLWRRRVLMRQMTDSLLARTEASPAECALGHLLQREQEAAEKAGREPDFYSPAIRDEVLGYLLAGHDTTATVLAWWLKRMTRHQDVQTRLRKALSDACPSARSESRLPTMSELLLLVMQVPYLDAVVEETLRCESVATFTVRRATCDTHVRGYHIPKGTDMMLCLAGPTLTRPAIAGSEKARPEVGSDEPGGVRAWDDRDITTYNPERWLRTETTRTGHAKIVFDRNAGPNLAFSCGRRQCFGKKQALLQLKMTITLLVWGCAFEPVEEPLNNEEITESLVNLPKNCYARIRVLRQMTSDALSAAV